MVERLFVYGTLAPGRPNGHILEAVGGTWEPASVAGTLYPEGWGAAVGYPGVVLDGGAGEVRGLLFTSRGLPAHWAALDEFEGEGYERVRTSVRLEDGSAVEAYIYALKPPRPGWAASRGG
jgi:gamma-glutamylcyclotransferase (GGCT)/AIG2-like uncharacterized protein YtfP